MEPRTSVRAAGGDAHRRLPRRPAALPLLCGLAAAIAVVLAAAAPPDAVQGEAQRLMYLHVPAAWCAFVAFGAVLVTSLRFLVRRERRDQVRARASAEAGVVLTLLAILTGSVWGRATWGVWWVWDARLTTTAALLFFYVGYLALRALTSGSRADVLVASVGAGGFLLVPVVHFSVLWWRTLHQPPTLLAPSTDPPIDPRMAAALAASVAAAMLLTAWSVRRRVRALESARPVPEPSHRPVLVP